MLSSSKGSEFSKQWHYHRFQAESMECEDLVVKLMNFWSKCSQWLKGDENSTAPQIIAKIYSISCSHPSWSRAFIKCWQLYKVSQGILVTEKAESCQNFRNMGRKFASNCFLEHMIISFHFAYSSMYKKSFDIVEFNCVSVFCKRKWCILRRIS